LNAFGALDWTGLAVWVLAWLGYSLYAERLGKPQANLMASVARFRRIWMREAYLRDPRMTDVALLGNLMHSATFFSSTTLLVLGASFALLGTIERGTEILEVMKTLPFATPARVEGGAADAALRLRVHALHLVAAPVQPAQHHAGRVPGQPRRA